MSDLYESPKLLSEYLLFHYGREEEILQSGQDWPDGMRRALDFPVRTVAHFSNDLVERGLDLGCAVGRSTLEMARNCREVVGVDFSHAFIHAATTLLSGSRIGFDRCEEAALMTRLEAELPAGIDVSRITFRHGDAMNLPEDLGAFDRVHAANLLCRLPEPRKLLNRLPSLVKSGGELVIATPCTWLEEYTAQENWPSGGTFNWLRSILERDFTLARTADEPFLIRETARKFQWTSSLLTLWQRK